MYYMIFPLYFQILQVQCAFQDVLYPLRKKADPTWNRKNLEDLKELKEKVNKIKEEKQKILENQPEPFKLKQFRNIPSKFMDTKSWVIKKQQKFRRNIFFQIIH